MPKTVNTGILLSEN